MSAEITAWLDHPLPVPVRLAIVVPALAIAVWIFSRPICGHRVWQYAVRQRTQPVAPTPCWVVLCDQCGRLDPPLTHSEDALEVGWFHECLHAGHRVTLSANGKRYEAA